MLEGRARDIMPVVRLPVSALSDEHLPTGDLSPIGSGNTPSLRLMTDIARQ